MYSISEYMHIFRWFNITFRIELVKISSLRNLTVYAHVSFLFRHRISLTYARQRHKVKKILRTHF